MPTNTSVQFFDQQFRKQPQGAAGELNPFERDTLPYLRGRVLDFGCGMGNLAVAAAERGCSVLALDASPAAIAHLQAVAHSRQLAIAPAVADLSTYALQDSFDAVVSIGLLMFFDCPSALRQLAALQRHVHPGGVAAVNVLVEGTTYMDMFDPAAHCLFAPGMLQAQFKGWRMEHSARQEFPAPGGTLKVFETVIARRPAEARACVPA